MSPYADLHLQDSVKEQLFRWKLHTLDRKCCSGVEKLRAVMEAHLQGGVSVQDLLEKTRSFITLLSPGGYSRTSRDLLRLSPHPEEDLTPLCC
ncbi:uncharacterized protein si:ch211-193l2.6 [Antennarius striatus]|uniref:uncharacterized protein si:ch211-193l2.6 n=1 Tax=Antennarius striatus TaxID=241820 RepID=UPI0035B35122